MPFIIAESCDHGDVELGVFCQCEHHFYVAAAHANVRRCATDRDFVTLTT